jgi:protein-S-isoprenylcysteine O-methyltransferase Ste14
MASDHLLLRQVVASGSGLVYWGGVLIQARRVRRKIGRTPNLRPKGAKEKLLWAGWLIVIAVWLVQPWFLRVNSAAPGLALLTGLMHPLELISGIALILGGYVWTLWCYAIMGSAWRIGISRQEKNKLVTTGPFARIRHPIYAFQIVMLMGAFLLLPTLISLAIVILHYVCVLIKSGDEEAHLEKLYDNEYRGYKARSGRLFPKMKI